MSEFDYVEYTEESQALSDERKKATIALRDMIALLAPSREKALALTKLEECFMWIGKAIKTQQERIKEEPPKV